LYFLKTRTVYNVRSICKTLQEFKAHRQQGLSWECRPGAWTPVLFKWCGKTGLFPRWCRLPHPGGKPHLLRGWPFSTSASSLVHLECPHQHIWSRDRQHIQLELSKPNCWVEFLTSYKGMLFSNLKLHSDPNMYKHSVHWYKVIVSITGVTFVTFVWPAWKISENWFSLYYKK